MNIAIDFETARARHPALVALIAVAFDKKMKAARCDMPELCDLAWSYDWAVSIGTGDPADGIFCCLKATLGRRSALEPLGAPRTPLPRADVPPEILDFYLGAKPLVDPATTDHVCAFDLFTNAGAKVALAIDGYTSRRGSFIRHKIIGERDAGIAVLLKIQGQAALWSGGLYRKAEEALVATAPGGVFRYRNAPLKRMTPAEIRDLVGGKRFTLQY